MNRIVLKLKDENANALIENAIVLPVVFIIIYALILTSFIVHERTVLEAAAKRGAIYASHCICDPNYEVIITDAGSEKGDIDISQSVKTFSFSGVGHKIKPYRYLTGGSSGIEKQVGEEVQGVIDKTRIPWRNIEVVGINYDTTNYVVYQDITVTVEANYKIAEYFKSIGLDTKYNYKVTAKMTVNDPDEFIRNADLIVDTATEVLNKTGNSNIVDSIKKSTETIDKIAAKISDWMS